MRFVAIVAFFIFIFFNGETLKLRWDLFGGFGCLVGGIDWFFCETLDLEIVRVGGFVFGAIEFFWGF